MFLWILATALAVEIEVAHDGYLQTYDVQPGEQVDETWVALERRRPTTKRDASYDLHVALQLTEAVDGHLRLHATLTEVKGDHLTILTRSTLQFLPSEGATLELGEERQAHVVRDGETHWLTRLTTRIVARPE